jgi:cytidylate kinase
VGSTTVIHSRRMDKTLEEIIAEINERDYRDMNREIAPLKQAEDAVLLDTTEMNLEEVVEAVCQLIDEAREAK